MRLTQLTIRQFRNIENIEVPPNKILNVLVGDNGQGKTSFIEAIYFLSVLRSFRTGKVDDLIQIGKNGFLLQCEIEDEGHPTTQAQIRIQDKTRKLSLNQKHVGSGSFVGSLRTVVFSPESLTAIKQGPESRRDLVDMAINQVSEEAQRGQRLFSRALRQRNACLRQIRDGELAPRPGQEILNSLQEAYLSSASTLVCERLKFLDLIFIRTENVLGKITGEAATLAFKYQSSAGVWTQRTIGDVYSRLRDELLAPERIRAEVASGVTLTGPHRHDLTFLFNGNDSRIFCSQGQQRALILAFKIAEIVYHSEAFGSYPLLLLDDVLSEFDESKRRFLIEFLQSNEAQTFLTTTDQSHFLENETVYHLKAGRVAPDANRALKDSK